MPRYGPWTAWTATTGWAIPSLRPEDLTDGSSPLAHLSQDLPYAKKEMFELLSAEYASQEEALETAERRCEAAYEAAYPEVAAAMPDEIDRPQRNWPRRS